MFENARVPNSFATSVCLCYTGGAVGRLAQLARARRSHRRGHWFESSIAHHTIAEAPDAIGRFCVSVTFHDLRRSPLSPALRPFDRLRTGKLRMYGSMILYIFGGSFSPGRAK